MATPVTAQLLSNGRLRLEYSATSSHLIFNGNATMGLHTIGGVTNAAATRFQFEDASSVTPHHLTSNTITANSELRAGFLNNDSQVIRNGINDEEDLEMSIVAPSSVTGTGSNKIRIRRLDIASPSSSAINPRFEQVFPFSLDWLDTDGGNGWLIPLTANAYTGPATDLALSGDSAMPDVNTDSGNGTTTTVFFTFAMGRRSNVIGAASGATLRVNGTPFSGTFAAGGTSSSITFPVAVNPGETVALSLPAGLFQLSENSSSTTYTHNNIVSTDIPVTNARTYDAPVFNGLGAVISNAGNRMTFSFDALVAQGSQAATMQLSVTGNLQGTRTFSFTSISGSNSVIFDRVSGNPLIVGEFISNIIVGAGLVRDPDAPSGTAENTGFTITGFTIVSGGQSVLPPIRIGNAVVSTDGLSITLNWFEPASYNTGVLTINAEFSPNITAKLAGGPSSGNGTDVWVYTLVGDPIRISDNVSLSIPAGLAIENTAMQTNAGASNEGTTNNSTIAYPKPTLVSGEIKADGQTAALTFGENVVLNSTVLEDRVVVVAQDVSDTINREFTSVTGTGSVVGGTVVEFDLTGAGTIFGNGVGGTGDPDDGDTPKAHSSGFAGLVTTQLSEDAGEPALLDPFGDEIDFSSSFALTNNSTQPEPASNVVPDIVSANVFNQGDAPIQQFLDIVFDDGTVSIELQRSTAFPTLTGSITGTAILSFVEIRSTAGDNDTIRFEITSEQFKREADGEILTVTIPVDVVVSDATGDSNLTAGPLVSNVASEFSNNSTIILPTEPQTPPEIQQVIVGVDGKLIGIYYDVDVFKVGGSITVEGLLTGTRTAPFAGIPDPDEDTLVTFMLSGIPIFKGEAVFVDVPANLVGNTVNGQQSLAVTQKQAINNSLEPAPLQPVLDSSTLNSPGTVIQLIFNVPVSAGTGLGHVVSSLSGRHDIEITSIASNIVSATVAGVIFADETVELFLDSAFVLEDLFDFVGNAALNNFVIDVSGRVGAPAIPVNAVDLNSEAVE